MMTTLLIIIFITFIGVGLPDSVLGTAWPAIYREFNLPVSLAGYISATVSACTIISSLISSKVINRFGTGVVSAVSTLMTAAALLGFAFANNAIPFFLLAIPLGLGAGSIDTALNNFVALHYSASKMNFLHCFYGLGVAASPYVMSLALGADDNWRKGYIIIGLIQFCIALIAAVSLPLWKKAEMKDRDENTSLPKTLTLSQLFKMPAVRLSCLAFFGSCALELCAGSWSSTYFVNIKGLPSDKAAQIAMLFYVGLASGRFLSGVVAHKTGRWENHPYCGVDSLWRNHSVYFTAAFVGFCCGVVLYRAWMRSCIPESDAPDAPELRRGYFAIGYRGAAGFLLRWHYVDAMVIWHIGAGNFYGYISILPVAFIRNIRINVIYVEKSGIGKKQGSVAD